MDNVLFLYNTNDDFNNACGLIQRSLFLGCLFSIKYNIYIKQLKLQT